MGWSGAKPKRSLIPTCKKCGIAEVAVEIKSAVKSSACIDCYRELERNWHRNCKRNTHTIAGRRPPPGKHEGPKLRAFRKFIQKWQRLDVMTKGKKARAGLELPPRYLRWRERKYAGWSFGKIIAHRALQRSAYNSCVVRTLKYGPDWAPFAKKRRPPESQRIPQPQRHRQLPLE